jgi:hypothetical protein
MGVFYFPWLGSSVVESARIEQSNVRRGSRGQKESDPSFRLLMYEVVLSG